MVVPSFQASLNLSFEIHEMIYLSFARGHSALVRRRGRSSWIATAKAAESARAAARRRDRRGLGPKAIASKRAARRPGRQESKSGQHSAALGHSKSGRHLKHSAALGHSKSGQLVHSAALGHSRPGQLVHSAELRHLKSGQHPESGRYSKSALARRRGRSGWIATAKAAARARAAARRPSRQSLGCPVPRHSSVSLRVEGWETGVASRAGSRSRVPRPRGW